MCCVNLVLEERGRRATLNIFTWQWYFAISPSFLCQFEFVRRHPSSLYFIDVRLLSYCIILLSMTKVFNLLSCSTCKRVAVWNKVVKLTVLEMTMFFNFAPLLSNLMWVCMECPENQFWNNSIHPTRQVPQKAKFTSVGLLERGGSGCLSGRTSVFTCSKENPAELY